MSAIALGTAIVYPVSMMNAYCEVCGSSKGVRKHQGKLVLCGMHRQQMRVFGKIRSRTLASRNDFVDKGDHYEVVIFGRDLKEKARALIDKDDRALVEPFGSWCLEKQGYAQNWRARRKMHQLIMGKRKGLEIDHINGEKLDNRRSNLRFVSHKENSQHWEFLRRRKLAMDFKAHLASGKSVEEFFATL